MASAPTPGSTGIELGITWADVSAWMVVERDTSGGFGTSVVIVTLKTAVVSYVDILPLDGVTYYYRAKHTKVGSVDSAWSSTVSDTPHELVL